MMYCILFLADQHPGIMVEEMQVDACQTIDEDFVFSEEELSEEMPDEEHEEESTLLSPPKSRCVANLIVLI